MVLVTDGAGLGSAVAAYRHAYVKAPTGSCGSCASPTCATPCTAGSKVVLQDGEHHHPDHLGAFESSGVPVTGFNVAGGLPRNLLLTPHRATFS